MSKIQEKLSNPAVFLSIYLVTVLATYILPYFGSNSWAGAQLKQKKNKAKGKKISRSTKK